MTRRLSQLVWVLTALVLLGVPTRVGAQEVVEYYGLDGVGSVRAVFSASGTLLSRVDYGPFGEQIAASTLVPKAYAQLFRDGEAGLDYAQARSYQQRTGRFSTADPVYVGAFSPQAWNRYSYALNTPLSHFDPTGLDPEEGDCDWVEGWVQTGENGEGYLGSHLHCSGAPKDVGGGGGGIVTGAWSTVFSWVFVAGPSIDTSNSNSTVEPSGGSGDSNTTERLNDLICQQYQCEDGKLPPVSMAGVPSGGAVGAAIVAIGARGEQLIKAVFSIGEKAQVVINGRVRIPDGRLDTVVTEIKNAAYQANTLQRN